MIAGRTRQPRLSDGNRVTKSQAAAPVVIDAHRQQFHCPRCRRRRAQDELQALAICLRCSPPPTEMYCHSPVSVTGSTRSTLKCGLASRTGPASQVKAATGWPAKNRLTCSSSAPHVSSHGGKSATAAAYIPRSAGRHSPRWPVRPRHQRHLTGPLPPAVSGSWPRSAARSTQQNASPPDRRRLAVKSAPMSARNRQGGSHLLGVLSRCAVDLRLGRAHCAVLRGCRRAGRDAWRPDRAVRRCGRRTASG